MEAARGKVCWLPGKAARELAFQELCFPAKEGGYYSVLVFCKVRVESWELGIGSFFLK